jgi:hypothetical protein
LSLRLARHRPFQDFAREMVLGYGRDPRASPHLARVTAAYAFVGRLSEGTLSRPGHALLLRLAEVAGPDGSAAVLLAALLLALGERAEVDYTRELVFVRVAVGPEDLSHVPPHAVVLRGSGGHFLALVAGGRAPLGYLPCPIREGLARRRRAAHPALVLR